MPSDDFSIEATPIGLGCVGDLIPTPGEGHAAQVCDSQTADWLGRENKLFHEIEIRRPHTTPDLNTVALATGVNADRSKERLEASTARGERQETTLRSDLRDRGARVPAPAGHTRVRARVGPSGLVMTRQRRASRRPLSVRGGV